MTGKRSEGANKIKESEVWNEYELQKGEYSMNKEKAFKNAKEIVGFLADNGLTFQEANEAILMAKAIFRGLQNAAVEKQKEAALADVTRTAKISLTQGDAHLKSKPDS